MPRSVFVLVIKGLRKLHDKRSPYSHSIHLILTITLSFSLAYHLPPSYISHYIYIPNTTYTSLLPLAIDPPRHESGRISSESLISQIPKRDRKQSIYVGHRIPSPPRLLFFTSFPSTTRVKVDHINWSITALHST